MTAHDWRCQDEANHYQRLKHQHIELEHTPKKPLPKGFTKISFIIGERGIAARCAISGCVEATFDH